MTGQVPDAGPYMSRWTSSSTPPTRAVRDRAAGGHGEGRRGRRGRRRRSGRVHRARADRCACRSGAPRALADALEPLLASPARRDEIGRAGRESFMREFTDAAMRSASSASSERYCKPNAVARRGAARRCASGASGGVSRRATPAGRLSRRSRARASPRRGEVTIVAHDIGGGAGDGAPALQSWCWGSPRAGHQVTVIARTCELPEGAGVSFHRVRGPGRPFLIAYPWFMLAGSLALRGGAAASCRPPGRSCSTAST